MNAGIVLGLIALFFVLAFIFGYFTPQSCDFIYYRENRLVVFFREFKKLYRSFLYKEVFPYMVEDVEKRSIIENHFYTIGTINDKINRAEKLLACSNNFSGTKNIDIRKEDYIELTNKILELSKIRRDLSNLLTLVEIADYSVESGKLFSKKDISDHLSFIDSFVIDMFSFLDKIFMPENHEKRSGNRIKDVL